MPILIYSPAANQAIGGIDEYTKLMLHMDGDQSDSQHVVTHNGNPQFSTAQSKFGGSSMYFDGSGDYLSIPISNDFSFGSGDFTIDMWINRANTAQNKRLITNQDIPTGHGFNLYISPTNQIVLGDTGINTGQVVTSEAIADTWTHFAAVGYNNTITLYINGVAKGNQTYTALSTPVVGLQIGRVASQVEYDMNGYIDELRISKGIARWTSNFSGSLPSVPYTSDANTKLLLHFDGDVSDSAHVVTVNGDPQLSATTAKFDGSMYFDGNGDYLSIPTSNDFSFGSGDFTVDFWIRFISPTDLITPIIGQMEDGSNRWHFVLNNNTGVNEGLLLFSTYSSGANMIVEAGSWFPNADTWYHIALVRSGGIIKIYVNGESQALSINNNPDESINIDSDLYIGDRGFDEFGNIYVDEFRISKGIARWTSNFTPESGPYTE